MMKFRIIITIELFYINDGLMKQEARENENELLIFNDLNGLILYVIVENYTTNCGPFFHAAASSAISSSGWININTHNTHRV